MVAAGALCNRLACTNPGTSAISNGTSATPISESWAQLSILLVNAIRVERSNVVEPPHDLDAALDGIVGLINEVFRLVVLAAFLAGVREFKPLRQVKVLYCVGRGWRRGRG